MFKKDGEEIGLIYEKMCWDGYRKDGTKQKNGKTVNNCVKDTEDEELPEEDSEHCDMTTKKNPPSKVGKKTKKILRGK